MKKYNAKKVLKTTLIFFSCAMHEKFMYVCVLYSRHCACTISGAQTVWNIVVKLQCITGFMFWKMSDGHQSTQTHTRTRTNDR